MGWAIALLSSPAPPVWGLGWPLPDLPSLPPMPPGPMWLVRRKVREGGPWRAGHRLGSSVGSQCLSGWVNRPPLLSCSSLRAPPACLSYSPLGLLPMPPRTHTTWRGFGGQWIGLGAQQAPRAPVGGAITLPSSSAPPGWPLPPATADLLGLPLMPLGPTQPGWGFGLGGKRLGSSAGSLALVGQAITLRFSPALP